MPSSTRSYIKRHSGKLIVSTCLLAFAVLSFFLVDIKAQLHCPGPAANVQNGTAAPAYIKKAEAYISSLPDSAERFAGLALEVSTAQQDALNETRSLIVLGKIKNLRGNQAVAKELYHAAALLAQKGNFSREASEAIIALGEITYKKGEYDQALQLFLRADTIAAENELTHLRSYTLYYIGKCHQTKGNFAQAKDYYHRSLALSRKNKDKRQLALLLPSLGKHYISEGKLNLALSCYQEAYHISTTMQDQLLSADICNHLGSLYIDLHEFDKAMGYHRKALQYRLSMQYPGELAKSYNNIGKIHLGLNQRDSARYYFERSLALCKRTDYKKGLVKAMVNLGKTQRLEKEMSKAYAHLSEALKISELIGYDNGIAEASLDLGELFLDRNMPDSAVFYYQRALAKLTRTDYHDELLTLYKGLYKCYDQKQDLKKALAYHVLLLETEKRSLDVENKRQLAILNITFDTERKEKDYQVLLKDNALKASMLQSKNTLIWLNIVALGFTIILCLYLYNRFYTKKRANKKLEELNHTITSQNQELKKLNKELETVSKEKDKLFSIISHEIRNPLYWLQNLAEALSQKHLSMPPEKIRKSLLSMDESAKNVYHLMDNLLHWSRSKLNRIHPKKQCHNLYALIGETTRMYETFLQQKEISLYNPVPKDIYIHADADLFACVLRNLISNAIKYTPAGGKISFLHEPGEEEVTLVICDSGKGMTTGELRNVLAFQDDTLSMPGLMQEKGSGLGLKLCKDFVEMNGGRIWAESIPGEGTRFFFTVPLQRPTFVSLEELQIAGNLN